MKVTKMRFQTRYSKFLRSSLPNYCYPLYIILFSSAVVFTSGQNVPSLNDPFPADPGPENPKQPYKGCPAECDTRLTNAMNLIADLQRQMTTLNITVTNRLNNVPTGGTGTDNSNEFSSRLINVENYLYGNMTTITDKLANDLAVTSASIRQNITDTRNLLDARINLIASTAGASAGTPSPAVYSNITSRLDKLEFDKVQTLIDENNVWRQNFEVVNRTFSKMKKSSYSNDVIVVG